jgi:hypothetical protein
MILVKTDRPRRVDRVIDYFGDPHHEASNDPRLVEAPAILVRLAEVGAV